MRATRSWFLFVGGTLSSSLTSDAPTSPLDPRASSVGTLDVCSSSSDLTDGEQTPLYGVFNLSSRGFECNMLELIRGVDDIGLRLVVTSEFQTLGRYFISSRGANPRDSSHVVSRVWN